MLVSMPGIFYERFKQSFNYKNCMQVKNDKSEHGSAMLQGNLVQKRKPQGFTY